MGRAFEARRAGKEKRWGEMSRLYPKLGKIITMAAKAGGSDPELQHGTEDGGEQRQGSEYA